MAEAGKEKAFDSSSLRETSGRIRRQGTASGIGGGGGSSAMLRSPFQHFLAERCAKLTREGASEAIRVAVFLRRAGATGRRCVHV